MSARPAEPSQKMKIAASVLAGLGAFAAVVCGGWLLLRSDGEALASAIHVEGPFVRVLPEEVTAAARPLLEQPFGALDLAQVRLAVEQLPWVARARVERQWPAAVRIRIWERTAVARWGERALLDSEAQVFTPPPEQIATELPRLQAPAGHEREVLDAYLRFKTDLTGSSFEPLALSMDARGEWVALGAQGIEMRLGRQPPQGHAALIRGALSRALEGNFAQVRYVDLRYTNGFSVGWTSPRAPLPTRDGGVGNG